MEGVERGRGWRGLACDITVVHSCDERQGQIQGAGHPRGAGGLGSPFLIASVLRAKQEAVRVGMGEKVLGFRRKRCEQAQGRGRRGLAGPLGSMQGESTVIVMN